MSPKIQKGISVTILSGFLTTFLFSLLAFYFKDTITRVNKTIDKVQTRDVQMVHIEDTINHLNIRLQKLDKSIIKTGDILQDYVKFHGTNLSRMTISMERVTQKLVTLEEDCDDEQAEVSKLREQIRACERK